MNQIKYILSACLIMLMIFMGIFLFKTFPESGIVQSNQATETNSPTTATPISSKGEQLFKQNCASCHAINKDITGPALGGVLNRGPWAEDKKHIYAWVRNPAEFMKKDLYTQGLKAKYAVMMTSFPQLKNEEIDAILNYIEDGAVKPLAVVN
jgi:mono/diheme cytochrome c family protein